MLSLKRTPKAGRSGRLGGMVACALFVTSAAGLPRAHAGAPVIDITSIVGDIQKWMDDTMVHAKEASRWEEMKAQIDGARAILDPLRFSMGLPEGVGMQPVEKDYLVKEACGKKAAGLDMQRVFPALRLDHRYEFEGQLRQICVNIQMMENQKFNETVLFLGTTMEQAEDAMRRVYNARASSGNTSGGVQSTQNDTARLTNQLNVLSQQWMTRMQGYDAYISAMDARRKVLTRAAFRGDPDATTVSDVVQTLALKRALQIESAAASK